MRRAIFSLSQDEDSFSFGPGTDLVFSLMSVVLLALIIGGILYSAELERLYSENQTYRDAMKDYVSRKEYERVKLEIDDLNALVPLLRAKIAEFEKSLDREPRGVWQLDEANYFNQGEAELLPQGKKLFLQHLSDIKDKLRNGQANQIKIVGYASPEPRITGMEEDQNLDLSAERAVSVAHYLNDLGISYDCMYVVGFGRGRSPILHDWLKREKGRTIERWDRLKPYHDTGRKTQSLLNKERKVLIYAVYDKDSMCTFN